MVASTKSSYKIRNWKDYNESLVRRSDITFWFDDDVIDAWDHTNDEPNLGYAAKSLTVSPTSGCRSSSGVSQQGHGER